MKNRGFKWFLMVLILLSLPGFAQETGKFGEGDKKTEYYNPKGLKNKSKPDGVGNTSKQGNGGAVTSNPPQDQNSVSSNALVTHSQLVISEWVLVFSFVIILLEILLIHFDSKFRDPNYILKFILITLIISGTFFVITAGYNSKDIAPALGLLGTIAGYLMSRQENTKPEVNSETHKNIENHES